MSHTDAREHLYEIAIFERDRDCGSRGAELDSVDTTELGLQCVRNRLAGSDNAHCEALENAINDAVGTGKAPEAIDGSNDAGATPEIRTLAEWNGSSAQRPDPDWWDQECIRQIDTVVFHERANPGAQSRRTPITNTSDLLRYDWLSNEAIARISQAL